MLEGRWVKTIVLTNPMRAMAVAAGEEIAAKDWRGCPAWPDRQNECGLCTMAVVPPEETIGGGGSHERRSLHRGGHSALAIAGRLYAAGMLIGGLPFIFAGGLKILYDILLYRRFNAVKPSRVSARNLIKQRFRSESCGPLLGTAAAGSPHTDTQSMVADQARLTCDQTIGNMIEVK